MSADLIERLQEAAQNPYGAIKAIQERGALAGEAAAEIVRLRGEVDRQDASHGNTIDQRDRAYEMIDSVYAAVMDANPEWSSAYGFADALNDIEDRIHAIRIATIAPAEAKGDVTGKNVHTEHCCREHGCKYGETDCPVENGRQAQSHPCEDCTPQPADGGAVAWLPSAHEWLSENQSDASQDWIDGWNACRNRWQSITHPPAAQVQPNYTTGHCKNKQQPGGCRLHNLHCGFPECDRRKAASTHHTGDALGAVREQLSEYMDAAGRLAIERGEFRILAERGQALADAVREHLRNLDWHECGPTKRASREKLDAALTAALQHRGDSRGGEGWS